MSDLYADTLETTRIPGLPRLRISTAVMEMVTGQRYLSATLSLTTDDAGTCMQVTVPLDPCTMRALAATMASRCRSWTSSCARRFRPRRHRDKCLPACAIPATFSPSPIWWRCRC